MLFDIWNLDMLSGRMHPCLYKKKKHQIVIIDGDEFKGLPCLKEGHTSLWLSLSNLSMLQPVGQDVIQLIMDRANTRRHTRETLPDRAEQRWDS